MYIFEQCRNEKNSFRIILTKLTFFFISEKLEDPDNYATVVDDKELTNNATLYMDPMNVKP